MSWRQPHKLLPYLFASLIVVASSLIVSLFATNTTVLIAIYIAAVAGASWYGGFGPALLATALSYLIANWYFIPTDGAFRPSATAFVFLFVCVAIGAFSEMSKRALRRAAQAPSKSGWSSRASPTVSWLSIARGGSST